MLLLLSLFIMRSTDRGIIFAVWNAHSVNNKRADIEYLLHDRELDILCITETWLEEGVAFEFYGYLTYRFDRPGGWRGWLCYSGSSAVTSMPTLLCGGLDIPNVRGVICVLRFLFMG